MSSEGRRFGADYAREYRGPALLREEGEGNAVPAHVQPGVSGDRRIEGPENAAARYGVQADRLWPLRVPAHLLLPGT